MKAELEKMLDELEKLTENMDVPDFRVRNVGWLSRNIGARNSNHPDFAKAMELIKKLRSNGVCS